MGCVAIAAVVVVAVPVVVVAAETESQLLPVVVAPRLARFPLFARQHHPVVVDDEDIQLVVQTATAAVFAVVVVDAEWATIL